MDDAWQITLTERDDIRLRSGSFAGDTQFRVFLCSKLEGKEQTFTFQVPAREIENWDPAQKIQIFNWAIDLVQTFVGTDLEQNERTQYVLRGGRFVPAEPADWLTRHVGNMNAGIA